MSWRSSNIQDVLIYLEDETFDEDSVFVFESHDELFIYLFLTFFFLGDPRFQLPTEYVLLTNCPVYCAHNKPLSRDCVRVKPRQVTSRLPQLTPAQVLMGSFSRGAGFRSRPRR